MKFGARIFKTGIAIMISILVCVFLNLGPAMFAAVAAAFTIQPSITKSWEHTKEQTKANILGTLIALLAYLLLGNNPVIVGLIVMLTISLNLQLKMEKSIPLTMVTVLTIMENTSGNTLMFTLERLTLLLIGILSSLVVNYIFFNPQYEKKLDKQFRILEESAQTLYAIILGENSSTSVIKAELNGFMAKMNTVQDIYTFYREDQRLWKNKNLVCKRTMILYKRRLEMYGSALSTFQSLKEIISENELNKEDIDLLNQVLSQIDSLQKIVHLQFDNKITSSNYITDSLQADYYKLFKQHAGDMNLYMISALMAAYSHHKNLEKCSRMLNRHK